MIAIVPARGNSKGLPGKNIKNLCGKPMIAYTIEEALKSKYIEEVIISTDCKEIEKIAIEYGAKSHFLRPEYLAADTSKAIDNYIFTISTLNEKFGYKIDDFIVLQPTSPLRVLEDIDASIKIFKSKDADSVISYTEEHHPIGWHKYITPEGKFKNIFDDNLLNRQEMKTSYFPNGAIFIFKFDLIKQNKYFNEKSYAYIMDRSRSVDVDTIEDFNYIKFLIMEKNNNV